MTALCRAGVNYGALPGTRGDCNQPVMSDEESREVGVRTGLWCRTHGEILSAAKGNVRADTRTKIAGTKPTTPVERRTQAERDALTDRLVAIVRAEPSDNLPVARDHVRVQLGVGIGLFQTLVNAATKRREVESLRGPATGLVPYGFDPRRYKALKVLSSAKRPMSPTAIGNAVGANADQVRRSLTPSVLAGEVVEVDGRYSLAPEQLRDAA